VKKNGERWLHTVSPRHRRLNPVRSNPSISMEMVAQVRDFSKSRGDARFLLTIIASYVNPYTGWAWPSLATLAHVTTKGKPYLLKLMHALEALSELEVRRGHGRGHPNHYRITICHERPPEPREKGNPSDDHFPGEKVIGEAEKVIDAPEKGNPRGLSSSETESWEVPGKRLRCVVVICTFLPGRICVSF
jgi:hypothetical protein